MTILSFLVIQIGHSAGQYFIHKADEIIFTGENTKTNGAEQFCLQSNREIHLVNLLRYCFKGLMTFASFEAFTFSLKI